MLGSHTYLLRFARSCPAREPELDVLDVRDRFVEQVRDVVVVEVVDDAATIAAADYEADVAAESPLGTGRRPRLWAGR